MELTGAPSDWQLGSPADMTAQLSTIIAQESDGGGSGALIQLGILLLIPFAMYFFLIRPQRRRVVLSLRPCSLSQIRYWSASPAVIVVTSRSSPKWAIRPVRTCSRFVVVPPFTSDRLAM